MNQSRFLILYLALALILKFTLATPVLAQSPVGDQVVFGQDLTLETEEKIEGDVVVFGGNVTMPTSSQIKGDLVVFGGNAEIDGTVTGNIGIIGGNIKLGRTALIEGDIGLVGGKADRAKEAIVIGRIEGLNDFIFGNERDSVMTPSPLNPEPPPIPPTPSPVDGRSPFPFFEYGMGDIILFLTLASVGCLMAALMSGSMKVIGATISKSTLRSLGQGLLSIVILIATLMIMIGISYIGLSRDNPMILLITLCLAFIPILALIALCIATFFGWIVIGQLIGGQLLRASGHSYPNLIGSTLLGVTFLTIVTRMPAIDMIPYLGRILDLLGVLLGIIVALTGLGAVILTRFGTQPYPSDSKTTEVIPELLGNDG